VEYPSEGYRVQIPNEHLVNAVKEIRKNLEHAVSLENEIGGHGLSLLAPIESDPNLQGTSHGRGHGISGALFFYVSLFKRLAEQSPSAAKQESLSWPLDDDFPFASLRIWASGNSKVFSGDESGELLRRLNDSVFWYSRHQRDLLLVLAKRWLDYPASFIKELGERLLHGPPQWEGEEVANFEERRAWSTLDRIEWLHSQGCKFDFDVDREIVALRQRAPNWQPKFAQKVTASMESRGGWVRKDTEHEALLKVPLNKIIETAEALKERDHETLVEKNPFAGLAARRPVRAFCALTVVSKLGRYPSWAWGVFLNEGTNRSDKPKFLALVAVRVSKLPPPVLGENLHEFCDWLLRSSGVLLRQFPAQFYDLWGVLRSTLQLEMGKSSIVRGNKEPDWAMEGLNSPVGKLAQALMNDTRTDTAEAGMGFPADWLSRISEMLALKGDLRGHGLVIFSFHLNWFFGRDRVWTERNLLSVLTADSLDQSAFWAGVFWAGQIKGVELFQRLKPELLKLAKQNSATPHKYTEILAGNVLAGWGSVDISSGKRLVTNDELREVLIVTSEDFRAHLLWYLERWFSDVQDANEQWSNDVQVFLNEVWPRQKSVKTPRMTGKLCELAFSKPSMFPQIVDLILPLVTKIDQATSQSLVQLDDSTVRQYPEKALTLLSVILPENASSWPYDIESILDEIGNSDPSLLKDPRLIELRRRRLNSR